MDGCRKKFSSFVHSGHGIIISSSSSTNTDNKQYSPKTLRCVRGVCICVCRGEKGNNIAFWCHCPFFKHVWPGCFFPFCLFRVRTSAFIYAARKYGICFMFVVVSFIPRRPPVLYSPTRCVHLSANTCAPSSGRTGHVRSHNSSIAWSSSRHYVVNAVR